MKFFKFLINFYILKITIFVVCSIALTIQCIDLYKEYKSYQTIVTVNIERESIIKLPAVAICEGNPFVGFQLDNRSRLLPIPKGLWFKAKYKHNLSLDDGIDFQHFDKLHERVKDVFGPVNDGYINCETNTGSCKPVNHVNDFFSTCTTFFSTIYNNGTSKIIPENTIKIFDLEIDQWKLKADESVKISINKNVSKDYHTNQFAVAIIPSNSIPDFAVQRFAFKQKLLKFGRRYDVTFSKTKIINLPKPYNTSCHDYKNSQNDKSYSDCVRRCMIMKCLNKNKCLFIGMQFILNGEFNDEKLCKTEVKFNFTEFINFFYQCRHKICLPDCVQEIYSYEIKDVTHSHFDISFSLFNDTIDINNTIVINILPRDTNVYIYTHLPKISFDDLLSKFGGLISLWLGFSFYSVYYHTESFIRIYLIKKVSLMHMQIELKIIFHDFSKGNQKTQENLSKD